MRKPQSFKPGDSRINRNGRPKKGTSLTEILKYKLDQKTDDNSNKKVLNREIIAEKLIELAKKGNIAAIKYIYDRLEGLPIQAIDISRSREDTLPKDMDEIQSEIEQLEVDLGYKTDKSVGQ
jgi:hypothetical protein